MPIHRTIARRARTVGPLLLTAMMFLPAPRLLAGAAEIKTSPKDAPDAGVVDMAFGAASCAIRAGAVSDPQTLTVIDYSKPSTEDRLFVYDLDSRQLEYAELVAHGSGSGENMATRFSNDADTHE